MNEKTNIDIFKEPKKPKENLILPFAYELSRLQLELKDLEHKGIDPYTKEKVRKIIAICENLLALVDIAVNKFADKPQEVYVWTSIMEIYKYAYRTKESVKETFKELLRF